MQEPSTDQYSVNIEYVEKLIEECRRINALDFSKITWTREGRPIEISNKVLEDWKFIGLNNIHFIQDKFYLGLFEENHT